MCRRISSLPPSLCRAGDAAADLAEAAALERERDLVVAAYAHGVVHVLSSAQIKAMRGPGTGAFKASPPPPPAHALARCLAAAHPIKVGCQSAGLHARCCSDAARAPVRASLQAFVLNHVYAPMVANARPAAASYNLPTNTLLEMRATFEV